jgi:hypothetical protein
MSIGQSKSKQNHSLEQVAEEFLRGHLRSNPELEVVPVQCHVDTKALARAATHEDVTDFLDALPQFDTDDTEVPDELVHTEPAAEDAIDIEDAEPLILSRRLGNRQIYFSGVHERSKRLLWTYDARLAHRFRDKADVITTVFQFRDKGDLVMKDVFASLGLTLMAPPPTPSF